MTRSHSPFDSERDAVLGEALRRALDPRDSAEFVSRVMARVATGRPGPGHWDVLAGWARAGIAAALAAAIAAGFLIGRRLTRPSTIEETVALNGAVVLESVDPPGVEGVFTAFTER